MPKLLDFGIAKLLDPDAASGQQTGNETAISWLMARRNRARRW